MERSARALASAWLLLADGDHDGACNRAYYAMFDAARAALLSAGTDAGSMKTHRGLIAGFGKALVVTGRVDAEFGRSLNRVESLRLVADYLDEPPMTRDAGWAIEQAESFVAHLRSRSLIP